MTETLQQQSILDIYRYIDEIEKYAQFDPANVTILAGTRTTPTSDDFQCSDENGDQTICRPSISFGYNAIIIKYKGKVSASLFYRIENDSLVILQIIGEKKAKTGFLFDYRHLLVLVAESIAKQHGMTQVIILCDENTPYYYFARLDNTYKNSEAVGSRLHYERNDVGNMVKRILRETSYTSTTMYSMVGAEGFEPPTPSV